MFNCESQYAMEDEPGNSGVGDLALSDIWKKASVKELQWQLILDQRLTYESEWIAPNNTLDGPIRATDKQDLWRSKLDSSTPSDLLLSGSMSESPLDADTNDSARILGKTSVESNPTKMAKIEGSMWRTADSKELATLISQKCRVHVQNCDLPSSQKCLTNKEPLASSHLAFSKDNKSDDSSAERIFVDLYGLCHRQAPTESENLSLLCSEQIYLYPHLTSVPLSTLEPMSPSKSYQVQSVTRKVHSEFVESVGDQGFEALGEALCHSQTRARQAEKLVAQELQEREKLALLLFRESWAARTYKHWAHTLELENMWLKMCLPDEKETYMGKSGQIAIEPKKHNGNSVSGERIHCHFTRLWEGKQCKRASVLERRSGWLHVTMGLAFALGLSFVGAGLTIGWSVGWIIVSY